MELARLELAKSACVVLELARLVLVCARLESARFELGVLVLAELMLRWLELA